MMSLPVPKDVTERLDKMEANMDAIVTGLAEIAEILREQTEILRSTDA